MDEAILVASSEHPLLSRNARTSSSEDIASCYFWRRCMGPNQIAHLLHALLDHMTAQKQIKSYSKKTTLPNLHHTGHIWPHYCHH